MTVTAAELRVGDRLLTPQGDRAAVHVVRVDDEGVTIQTAGHRPFRAAHSTRFNIERPAVTP